MGPSDMISSLYLFTRGQTGQSGLGKSTLINSLFMTDIYEDSTYPDPVIRMPQTTQVRSYALVLRSRLATSVVSIIASSHLNECCMYTHPSTHRSAFLISSVV